MLYYEQILLWKIILDKFISKIKRILKLLKIDFILLKKFSVEKKIILCMSLNFIYIQILYIYK